MWNYTEERLRNAFVLLMVLSVIGQFALIGLVFDDLDWGTEGNKLLPVVGLAIIAMTSIEAWNVGSQVYRRAFVDWPAQNPAQVVAKAAVATGPSPPPSPSEKPES